MWRATRISADTADKVQVNAGILVSDFDVTNPVEPEDSVIVCETTGDFSISCVPTIEDFLADVNNAPTNTKEGRQITGWDASLSITAISITEETLKLALGASEVGENGGISGRRCFRAEDFKKMYWLGDMFDENKLFVVEMDNTVSTGGFSFTSTNNGKGGLSLTLSPHFTTADIEKVPMTCYILEKVDSGEV